MLVSRPSVSTFTLKSIQRHVILGLLLPVLALFSLRLQAQQLTGSLSGTSVDQSGAVIPKAKVVLKNEASGDVRTTVSDSSGYWSITAVQPATYTVTVSAAGFSTWQAHGIVMSLGDSRSLSNIKLKIGGNSTEIEVVSGADVSVPLDTGEVSTTLNEQMINDIVLQGRDAGELLKIMPGMGMNGGLNNKSSFNDGTVGTNNGPVGSFSSNGTQPNGSMAFMLDGANLVDPGNAGTQIANINQDMTSEIKVLQSDYSAEYAKGPTIFEAFGKSGGTHYHGEAYLYARNSTLNSFESYAKSQYVNDLNGGTLTPAITASLKPAEHFYYMGGNFGGPVMIPFTNFNKIHKKLFFWGGYEYMNQHPATQPINYNVPTAAQLSGDFSNTGVPAGAISAWSYAYQNPSSNLPAGATSTFIPKSDFDPNVNGLLGLYPAANVTPSAGNGWNNYQFGNNVPQNRWEATGKVDYAISDNTKVSVSYTRQVENDQHPIAIWWAAPWTLPYPSGVVAATTSNEVMANVTHVFNASTTNEFVYALARYINPSTLSNPAAVDRAKLGFGVQGLFGHTTSQIPNIEGPWGGAFPNISEFGFDGSFNGGGAFGGLKKAPAIYDNFTKILGVHSIKVGAYWDTQENIQSSSGASNGTFNLGWSGIGTGNVVADFLLGRPGNYQQSSAVPVDDVKYHQWSLYAQDSWKVNKQLTLNYGLRLDHVGQWYGMPLGIQVWDPTTYTNSPTAINPGIQYHSINSAIPLSGFVSPLFYPEPRVSFAYDITGAGKTVLRGGIALFRYQISTEVCNNNACDGPSGTFTYQTTATITGGYAGISSPAFTPPAGTSQNGSTIQVLQKGDNRTPQTLDWNITLSQALPWRSVFEASYVANKSINEVINGANGKYGDLNNVSPGSYFLPDPITGKVLAPNDPAFNSGDFRPLQNYGDVYLLSHGSYANYNSIQMSWQKQSGPVTFLTNYSFSKVLGIRDGDSSNGSGNGSMVDPFNLRNNYGPLAYDHTQILNLAYVWNMPKPIHGNRLLGGAVNGWQLSGVTQFQSGAPLQPNMGGNLNAVYPGSLPTKFTLPNGTTTNQITPSTWFGTNSYNVIVPMVTCNPTSNLSKGQSFNPKCFAPPAYGQQGTLNMPYMRGPAYFNSDLALFKNFQVTENQKVQFRLGAANFLNHPLRQFGLAGNSDETLNFTNTDGSLSQTNTNATTTGKPAFTTGGRQLTLAVKYYF